MTNKTGKSSSTTGWTIRRSTMLSLIARFWDVERGCIEMGGVDIRSMKCDAVMEHISIVFQKAYLFHDTIEANICFNNPNTTRTQVMEAAQKAHCHEFIRPATIRLWAKVAAPPPAGSASALPSPGRF